jgi:hypothetical protein
VTIWRRSAHQPAHVGATASATRRRSSSAGGVTAHAAEARAASRAVGDGLLGPADQLDGGE